MRALLTALRPLAITPGKVLIWRETSAQHHLAEGGEFFMKGAGMGVPMQRGSAPLKTCALEARHSRSGERSLREFA
jgi:hypothetical protein